MGRSSFFSPTPLPRLHTFCSHQSLIFSFHPLGNSCELSRTWKIKSYPVMSLLRHSNLRCFCSPMPRNQGCCLKILEYNYDYFVKFWWLISIGSHFYPHATHVHYYKTPPLRFRKVLYNVLDFGYLKPYSWLAVPVFTI